MKNLYLIVSIDDYILNEEKNKIIKLHENYDLIKYDMTVSKMEEIEYEIKSVSLFSDKKLIICENSFFFSKDEENEIKKLEEIIKNINNDVVLVFLANTIDRRKKIINNFKTNGNLIEITENKIYLKDYIKNNIKISNINADLLIDRTNENLGILKHEIEKLNLYKEEEITKEDILEIVPLYKEFDTFMLIEAILNKDTNKMLEIYDYLITIKEDETKILVTLANQIRLIYQVKILKEKMKESEIASYLEIHPYRVKLAKEKASQFSFKELEDYLLDLGDLDIKIKTSEIDKKGSLEMFFLKI